MNLARREASEAHSSATVQDCMAPLNDGRKHCRGPANGDGIADPGLCLWMLLYFIDGPIKEEEAPA